MLVWSAISLLSPHSMPYTRVYIYLSIYLYPGWWYTYPSEKYESVGVTIPNIWKVIIHSMVPVTTIPQAAQWKGESTDLSVSLNMVEINSLFFAAWPSLIGPGKWWIIMDPIFIYPWWLFNIAMENPVNKWRFIAGKIIYFYGPSIPWLC